MARPALPRRRLGVVVASGGVAAIEAALELRALAGEQIELTIAAAARDTEDDYRRGDEMLDAPIATGGRCDSDRARSAPRGPPS